MSLHSVDDLRHAGYILLVVIAIIILAAGLSDWRDG